MASSLPSGYELAARTLGWPALSEIPSGVRLNLGCGRVILPKEDGWVNVDRIPNEGVDVRCDLFEFPWPFETDYADYIIASHLVEHVPHQVWRTGPRGMEQRGYSTLLVPGKREVHPLDGFFAFFAECWRVLKPDGIVTVIVPHGASTGALQDPTHTRYIVPETFGYLSEQPDAPFDYGLGFRFEVASGEGVKLYLSPEWNAAFPPALESAIRHNWNVVLALRVDLRAVTL